MSSDHLFVYGTLRPDVPGSRHELLQPATHVGAAMFQGRLYDLGDYPGVTASDDPGDIVHGDVYRLHDPAATLERLDEYEGCEKYAPGQPEYERVIASVRPAHGGVMRAWLYLYLLPCENLRQIVPGDYLRDRNAREVKTRRPPTG